MRKRQAGAAGVGGSFANPAYECNERNEAIVTEAMIEAGVAFLREALGDLYPATLLDERELVSEFWRVMADAEAGSRI